MVYLNLGLLPLVLSLGSTEKSLAASSLHSPCRYLHLLMRPLSSLHVTRQKQSQISHPHLTWKMLQYLSGTLLDLLQYVQVFFIALVQFLIKI